jgi:hypothetical protein
VKSAWRSRIYRAAHPGCTHHQLQANAVWRPPCGTPSSHHRQHVLSPKIFAVESRFNTTRLRCTWLPVECLAETLVPTVSQALTLSGFYVTNDTALCRVVHKAAPECSCKRPHFPISHIPYEAATVRKLSHTAPVRALHCLRSLPRARLLVSNNCLLPGIHADPTTNTAKQQQRRACSAVAFHHTARVAAACLETIYVNIMGRMWSGQVDAGSRLFAAVSYAHATAVLSW